MGWFWSKIKGFNPDFGATFRALQMVLEHIHYLYESSVVPVICQSTRPLADVAILTGNMAMAFNYCIAANS